MLKKIMHYITITATAIILAVGLLFTVPRAFGIMPYTILSGSMEPVIHTGSVVFINTKDRDVQIQDIAAFYDAGENDKTICHRIIDKQEDGFVTKGDANDVADMVLLTPNRVIGKYLFSLPQMGFVLEKKVPLLCLYIALNLMEYALPEKKKEENEEDSKNEESKEN